MVGAYLYLRIIRPPKDGGAEAAPPSATRKEALGGQGSALGRGIGALWGSRSSDGPTASHFGLRKKWRVFYSIKYPKK